ncbi:hypothetical protein DMN91_010852 [Ooceraea biroi]|uniref:Large ribosomal subunit protein mL38 n=1 Tax=Ooceraea biroi TaxID=2015173 RepID=A0A026WSI7_OOCBI|nr:39S ribosomal protein L38, mitochondrial [Ooceraea biroi]EZA58997.1 39S ribosomal protein L38, mitochondrial [Ooceraea biroi]RLU16784.1 hypothetical protein DMN91_010852 [Ooceraea biroi]
MSVKLLRFTDLLIPRGQHVRYGHRLRGRPPTLARSLKQRLDELNWKDPTLHFRVNIGYALKRRSVDRATLKEYVKHRNDPELEKVSRTRQLTVDLQKVREDWQQTDSPVHTQRIAEYYGIYNDLYGDAYFAPVVPLEIKYSLKDEKMVKVYNGNVIKSDEASGKPDVHYNAEDGSVWTLLMTTPDGNLTSADNEYCHWFVANIPGNRLQEGEELVDYLRPIVPYGIGYCRYIFVLYKQERHIDLSEYKRTSPCLTLQERNWKTLDFYRKYQDQLTPAGLAFFQSDWDSSLKDFYHNTLKVRVPMFRYDFPAPFLNKQEWFPLKKPFNIYLDKYRDPKQIMKEFLLRKLKKVHPFNGPEPKPKFPLAYSMPRERIPSWLAFEMFKKRKGQGRVNDLDEY